MQNTFITAGVFAAAMALNTGASSGADTVNRGRTDTGQEGGQAIVGKLVSLSDYLGMDDQAGGATATPRTTTSSSSQTPSRSDAKRLGSQAGKSGGLGGVRGESATSGALDQRGPQGSRVTNQPDTSLHAMSPDSSKEQTLVLIAQHGAIRGVQAPPVGLTSQGVNQPPEGKFGADQRSLPGTSPMAAGGHAYILLFGDDASSQSAYLMAKGMITDGSSNWAASSAEAGDRIPVRGEDDARPGAPRDVTRSQAAEETTATGRTGQRDPAGKWSKTDSQVRVTGALVSRGGIQAIRVSEISVASMLNDPASKSPGHLDRDRSNVDSGRKPELSDKKSR